MSRSKTYRLTPIGAIAVLAAILCFLAAVGFGCWDTVNLRGGEAPNITSAGAACGFGIAGGLCVLAAAVAEAGFARTQPEPPNYTTPPSYTPPSFAPPEE